MAWYNTYRPTKFEDVLGQDLVKQILMRAVATGEIRHAYLLSGPRGVGKTTLARIFAHEINGASADVGAQVDIVELDAASNTGIDDIRQLRESAQVPPISSKYKVFIIDEVHMLSKSAMNALLKILEEPPAYLVFLLATTNPEKILPTVLSRLTKLPLKPHTKEDLIKQLQKIAHSEKLEISQDALTLIAERAGGAQRDSINTLETLAGYGFKELTVQVVANVLGIVPEDSIKLFASVLTGDPQLLREYIITLDNLGIEPSQFLDQAMGYYLDQAVLYNKPQPTLIQSLATVISMRLPLVSNTQAVALVSAYLPQTIHTTIPKTVASTPSEPTQITAPKNEPTPAPEQTSVPEKKTPPASEPASTSVSEILSRSDKPNALKLIPDLKIGFDGTKVTVSTAVGMFLPSLKSIAVQAWFDTSIKEMLGQSYPIEVVQADKLTVPEQPKKQPSKTIAKPAQQSSPTGAPASDPQKPFYGVYGTLPKEGNIKGLKALEGELEDPKNKTLDKSFDDHVDEMFEFE